MIQAFGLTSTPRKELPPAVDDVSFEARAGRVTALLGEPGAGKTTVLRLMLELQRGRGVTHFRGRPLHRIAHPSREVGVLLGEVPGHPARTVRGHLRMLCAAAGVPVRRADEVLEAAGLVSLRDERLGTLSRGTDRRLGLACALLADPHTLVLDGPAEGLSVRESRWLHDALRAYAVQGGTVLYTTADPKEAARAADHVVTLERGKVVADQQAADFSRTRLRPRVAVRSPHAARLATLLAKEARTAHRSVEVVREGGNRLSVYGSTCADVGETAFRHGILVHQLAHEVGDMGPGAGTEERFGPEVLTVTAGNGPEPGPPAARGTDAAGAEQETDPSARPGPAVTAAKGPEPGQPDATTVAPTDARQATNRPAPASTTSTAATAVAPGNRTGSARPDPAPLQPAPTSALRTPAPAPSPALSLTPGNDPLGGASSVLPPPISVRSAPSPLRPLRYELRRVTGVGTGIVTGAVVLVLSAVTAVLLARVGHTPQPRLLAAWPREVPLPPAALGAGLLGALAFGDEFRHPALAADRGTVPRRLGLLTAKLVVSAATALLLAVLTVGCDAQVLHLFYGREFVRVPADWAALSAGWAGLTIGCAWAGVLAAGLFRSTTAGLAAVVAVPVVVVPLVQKVWNGQSVRTAADLPMRVREILLSQWPFGGERYVVAVLQALVQPVGSALALSLTALLCAYLLMTLRGRVR
ncbi:ATP-binding cassette domain-containing protein [Streptomyces sp. ISL-12]|uniref:ABC transporter ATP-binding protein n=1 Tax=Streptomyces sp. ISL-12 TaxID=2819177 RepID=UPI001BE75DFA|nr:ABC transporter ATP-binding protein [Streptomyces sp. ISL-12]MBT2414916.1 ATP-binding cassette domain-containing protein [Streptomyces sp. ISL-12]